ncbi:DUF2651 family protein [Fictibacillus nanhaiensis]|uniref:DUF2651 family protein n=1 Tax=Fictibacillus nanhaiensis TaxID=742169 RepID=A0ABS2ZS99_9BACL|nr:DUF2651 family protein [Fictibacillus nanhaiensis]
MIGIVFLLIFIFIPLTTIVVSIVGTLITKNMFVTPILFGLTLILLNFLNIFEVGLFPILIYTALSFSTSYITSIIKNRRSSIQTKTL